MVDGEQSLLDQPVEMEAGRVGRDPDLTGSLLAPDPIVAARDERVEAAAQRIGQRPDRGERVSHRHLLLTARASNRHITHS